jgi:dienelactone hydrolase
MRLTPVAKGFITIVALGVIGLAVYRSGWIGKLAPSAPKQASSVPPKADLPEPAAPVAPSGPPGCANLPEVRFYHWAWNAQAGNPFAGKVDLQRIALIGHSRGGEAVATAAVFNRLPYDPDNARLRFDYDFAIRAVVAIAPVDGQYRPGGRSAALQDVDYLTLQGAQDADVRSMSGARAYERVRFSGDAFHFKAAVYLAGANHGQFNASWGAADITGWPARLLNRSALLAEQDQQRVAQAAISAFLDASLNGNTGYLGLFRNPLAGAAWLPDALLVTQYQDSTFIPVADFEEDLDLTTASLPGAALSGEGLDSWREQVVSLRSGSRETSAVSLRWKRAEGEPEPLYRLRLPAGVLELDGTAQLSFTLADTRELPGAGEALLPALQASLELVDRAGNAARLPLDQAAPLRSPISTAVMKASFLDRYVDAEPIYQTFVFPLQAFAAANPQLEIASLAEIRFIFASPKGEQLLDHLGFSAPAP